MFFNVALIHKTESHICLFHKGEWPKREERRMMCCLSSHNLDQACLISRLLHLVSRSRLRENSIWRKRDAQITVWPSASAVGLVVLREMWRRSIEQSKKILYMFNCHSFLVKVKEAVQYFTDLTAISSFNICESSKYKGNTW